MKKLLHVVLCTLFFSTFAVVAASDTNAQRQAQFADKSANQWQTIEWSLINPTFVDNPYDLIAKVTFVHSETGEKRVTQMFYDENNTWKFRFTGTVPGKWTFKTTSEDTDLDEKHGTVTVTPLNTNGFVTGLGDKWLWSGSDKAFVPQLIMYASPKYFYNNPEKIDADIQTFLIEHGFNGFHVMGSCHWFDIDKLSANEIDTDPNPDRRTFEAFELLIGKTHKAGGMVHIWLWGDDQRKWTPTKWGKNGAVDKRLQRYIAARLGPLPGWTMGYGFDNFEWVNEEDLKQWHSYMHEHFGWPHLLGARAHNSKLTQIYEGLDYSSYEQWRPDYKTYVESIEKRPSKPSFSEDRFRVRQADNYAYKDYDMEMTRRGLWQSTMAGGVANIWGWLDGQDSHLGSKPYSNPEQIKTWSIFFETRFTKNLVRDNTLTDGWCLKTPDNKNLIIYKENATSVTLDLSQTSLHHNAVAVDTKKPYHEIKIENLTTTKQSWQAPYETDWAIALGNLSKK